MKRLTRQTCIPGRPGSPGFPTSPATPWTVQQCSATEQQKSLCSS